MGQPSLLRRALLCRFKLCHTFSGESDDTGVWGECTICGKRVGFVDRATLRAYADAEWEREQAGRSASNPEEGGASNLRERSAREDLSPAARAALQKEEEVDRVRVEIGAVQAENERLKAERDAAQAMVRQMSDAFITLTDGGPQFYIASEGGRVDAWGCVSYARDLHDRLRTALAESERKRVEEAAKATGLIAFRAAVYRVAGPRPPDWYGDEPAWNVDLFEVERIFSRSSATLTQETSHVES